MFEMKAEFSLVCLLHEVVVLEARGWFLIFQLPAKLQEKKHASLGAQ
jgi:hypothetical protein